MFIFFISSLDSSIVQRKNSSMNLKEKATTTRKEKHNVWKRLDLRQCQSSCQGQMRSYFIRNNDFVCSIHKQNYMEIRIQNEFMCYMNKDRLMYYHLLGVLLVKIAWELDKQLPMQSVPITTNILSSNPAHDELHKIQPYMITFASDLQQVCSFHRIFRFPPTIKKMGGER